MRDYTDFDRTCLAAALGDRIGYERYEVCPHCGESRGVRATHCTECGKAILYWQNKGGHDVLAYEEDETPVSICCGVEMPMWPESDICTESREHTDVEGGEYE